MNSFQPCLVNQAGARIDDPDSHVPAVERFTGEVEGININGFSSPLHHPGDKLFGVQGVVLAGEDLLDGAAVAARKPSHPSRVDMEFTQPADARQGAPQRLKNRVRVVLVPRIMGGLMRRPLAGAGHCEDHMLGICRRVFLGSRGISVPVQHYAKKGHSRFEPARRCGNRGDKLVEYLPGKHEFSHRATPFRRIRRRS